MLPSPAELLFRIQETKSPTGNITYLVTCDSPRQIGKQGGLCLAITQALTQRPRQSDLGYTLVCWQYLSERSCLISLAPSFHVFRYHEPELFQV